MLTTADHEGVVGGYRVLKGLVDAGVPGEATPRVQLALPSSVETSEAKKASRKLADVCRQFLDLDLLDDDLPTATHAGDWQAHEALVGRWPSAAAAREAVALLETHLLTNQPAMTDSPFASLADLAEEPSQPVFDEAIPPIARPTPTRQPPAAEPMRIVPQDEPAPAPMPIEPAVATSNGGADEVFELAAGQSLADAALARDGQFAATPIVPPMLPDGRVAVARDGTLVLLAPAATGLTNLSAIARAAAWLGENRQLLGMALGQFRLNDTLPQTQLLVDHADAGAAALQALIGTGRVTIRVCRRLSWGGRVGLLLDAA